MKKFKNNQSGRSMVEMLGVLAIIGVLSVGGIAGYSMAMQKFRTNQAIETIQLMMTETRATFGSQASYAGLNNANINKTIVDNTVTTTPFAGITLAEDTTDKTLFTITIDEVPLASCISLATSNWGSVATGFEGLKINNNALNLNTIADDSSVLETANDACIAAASDDIITNMVWTFR